MKIAIDCRSPLLQKSLELFLHKHLCSLKQCDIVIRDKACLDDERCFYIASDTDADLMKPFSKSQLILALENRYKQLNKDVKELQKESFIAEQSLNFEVLEKRIEFLTHEYQANILQAIRAFYEK